MKKRTLFGKGDRIGLYMIGASLAVIGAAAALLSTNQLDAEERRLRSDAISLARILAGVPYDQLTARGGSLEVLRQARQRGDFAYATIVGIDGQAAVEVAAPGVIVPPTAHADRLEAWISEHEIRTGDGAAVIEIQAPILDESELAGRLRLGFFKPSLTLQMDDVPFFATLVFLVFLLTPIFYLLIRREVRPLRAANERLSALVQDGRVSELELRASGELGEFMENFNDFVRFARERIKHLEQEHTTLDTRAKLLGYKKSRIESVLDSIPEAIIVIDQTGAISFANYSVEKLLGVSRERILHKEPTTWCDHPDVLDVLARYSSSQSVKQYLAQTMRIQPGKTLQQNLSIKAYPLFAPDNTSDLQGTLVVIRDASKEVASRQNQTEFVSHVAHELKTPLNTIGLSSERLLYDTELTESARIEAANIIQDEVDRMATLISNLLSMTKIEMGELPIRRTHVKLREFLEDVFDNVTRSSGDKALDFKLNLENDYDIAFLDKDLLRIAINNLLTNAIKYSDPGGSVILTGEESDDEVRIIVEDQGIGISATDQRQIFEKFYRSDSSDVRQRVGHGLGLSLAHEIVRMHNGTLSVVSEPGQGSKFTIALRKDVSALRQAI